MILVLLQGEEASLLAQARDEGPRDFLMIYLALNTGLRNTELISLNVEDVYDYRTVLNFLDLRKSTTKGKKPRTIPIHSALKIEIGNFLDWKIDHKEDTTPSSPLFISKKTGNRLSPRDFQRIVRSISLKAIRRPIHPHSLRHTFATHLLGKTNIRVVQELLGHSRLSSTQIYTHVSMADSISAIDGLMTP